MLNYSENKPSKEYIKHIEYYKKMHREGYSLINGKFRKSENAYDGKSTIAFAHTINKIIIKNSILSLLDYGCGKAFYYNNGFTIDNKKINSLRDHWKADINLYDPCFEKYSKFPDKRVDLTICIDVLEHIPEIDIDWILHKIFSITNKFVFLNIACYNAIALLPNGQNAHTNIKEPKWWFEKLVSFKKEFPSLKIICLCAVINEKGQKDYFPINIDDKITNYA